MTITPRLVAYIDEAGCSGDRYGTGSSQFLAIGAIVMATEDESEILRCVFDGARTARTHERTFKKFSSCGEKDNFVLTNLLGKQKVRIAQVAVHKPSMDGSWLRANHQNEYQYLMKFALERISWIARDAARGRDGDEHKCRIVFSEQSMYPYEDLEFYLRSLKSNHTHNCRIEWKFLHISSPLERTPHVNETSIHLADIAASAFHKAIEPKEHGMLDDRFQMNLSPALYRKHGKLYGIKLFPTKEIEQLKSSGHFQFLKLIP